MIEIVLAYFIFRGLRIILEKYEFYSEYEVWSSRKNIFFYRMGKCTFCMDHHLAIASTSIVGLLVGFQLYFLVLPLVVASIQNLINDRSRD